MAEINDYLKGLNEQVVQSEKEIVVVENPVVVQLCEKLEEWFDKTRIGVMSDTAFSIAHDIIGNFHFSAKTIEQFCFELSKYEQDGLFIYTGVFLSALTETSKDDYFKLFIKTRSKIKQIGYRNKKNIKVFGNAGDSFGAYMEKGVLCIAGSVDDFLGYSLNGGKIKVLGNAGGATGNDSLGGSIYVSGNIKQICPSCMAKVYKKGKQVWPR